MANCPRCGTQTTGAEKFCGQCGAPLPAAVAQQPAPGPFIPSYQPAPPQPKSKGNNGLMIALAGLAGLAVLGGGAWYAFFRKPAPAIKPVVQNPTTADPGQKPANPTPAPTNNPTPAPAAGGTWAKLLAQGKIDVSFQAFDYFEDGYIIVADTKNGNVEATVLSYNPKTKQLEKEVGVVEPFGQVRDVSHGDLNNDGHQQAMITAEKGLIIVPEEGEHRTYNLQVEQAFLADFDADGQQENLMISKKADAYTMELYRYKPNEANGTKLGSFASFQKPPGLQVSKLTSNKRALLMSAAGDSTKNQLPVTFYTVDAAKGMQVAATYPLPFNPGDHVASLAAGPVKDKPAIIASYKASPSFLKLYDISGQSVVAQAQVNLPDGDDYMLILGSYTSDTANEVLAITPAGKWLLFGL